MIKLSQPMEEAIRFSLSSGELDAKPNTLAALVRRGLAAERTTRTETGHMIARHYLTPAGMEVRTALREEIEAAAAKRRPAAPVADAPADGFDMANLTPDQIKIMETNIGRVPEVVRAAQDVGGTALVAFNGASSHHARIHQVTYYREGTAILGADVDPAAYSSAVCNANDTMRENGFPYMSAEWFGCFDPSYECMRVENATVRDRAAFYAAQDAETATCEHGNDGSTECAPCLAWDDAPAQTHVIRFVGMERTMCGEPVRQSMGTLRVSVDPTDATCPDCIAQEAQEAARDAYDGPTDDETHAAILAALTAAERHLDAAPGKEEHARAHARETGVYPRTLADGRTVWACCESSIGVPCQHRTGREPGDLSLIMEPCRTDRSKVTVWIMGAGESRSMTIRRGPDESLRAALWAHGHGFRPETRRGGKVAWQRHETLRLARLDVI